MLRKRHCAVSGGFNTRGMNGKGVAGSSDQLL